MRMYLSSYKIGDSRAELLRLMGPGRKAAVIRNALDHFSEEARSAHIARGGYDAIADFADLGVKAEDLDLRAYFEKPDDLRVRLEEYDLVWAHGGNSFLLRVAMQRSGFDAAIKDMLAEDKLVYGGFSAGFAVVTPTLKGIELVDPPEVVEQVYGGEVVWDGLGLVPFSIAPHYRSEHPESVMVDDCVRYFEEKGMPYKTLHDGGVVIVEDGQITVLDDREDYVAVSC